MSYNPGVHRSEHTILLSSSAGMSGLTPLLVGRFLNTDGTPRTLAHGLLRIENWGDFEANCLSSPLFVTVDDKGVQMLPLEEGGSKGKKRKSTLAAESDDEATIVPLDLPVNTIVLTEANINTGAIALSQYFDNGGNSTCYLLSLSEIDTLTEVPGLLSEYDDISLMAVIDASIETQGSNPSRTDAINVQLNLAIEDNLQSFLITRHASAATGEVGPVSVNNRNATYTPDLQLDFLPRLYDGGIVVKQSETQLIRLTDLQWGSAQEQTLYKSVKKALSTSKFDYTAAEEAPAFSTLSPCAAVAGAYCRRARISGIWHAPANINLVGATPAVGISKLNHTKLNDAHINAILWNPRYGTVIMGARTLEEASKPAWRYVPVRLLFNTVERDVRNMLTPVVFEPNSAPTWQTVNAAIDNYLYKLWKQGGLYGATPAEAYSVEVGLDAMQESDLGDGILRVRIGLAALRPVEFVFIEFTQDIPLMASA